MVGWGEMVAVPVRRRDLFEFYYQDVFSCPELLELVRVGVRLLINKKKKWKRFLDMFVCVCV